jgi:Ca2+-binding RTX toxin-like protein
MATIAGSLFIALAGGVPVNVVETSTGTGIGSDTIPGDFNLEVYTGPETYSGSPPEPSNVPAIAAGYQGLAILGLNGSRLDLESGSFSATDNGTGGDNLVADGTNATIVGGASTVNLVLNGSGNTAIGGGGTATIEVNGANNTVDGGGGPDTISATGNGDVVNGGVGADVLSATGNNDTIVAGSGGGTFNVVGNDVSVTGGSSADTIGVFGSNGVVNIGSGGGAVTVTGSGDTVNGGSGSATITLGGSGDTVNAGSGNLTVDMTNGGALQFNDDSSAIYQDTITGFSQPSGDRIHLTGSDMASSAPVNGGQDTLITLSDNSTILLKGVTSIDNSFFN